MMESLCNVALSYTPQDIESWFSGFGTLLIGVGTLGLAYAALKTIPEKFGGKHKDQDLVSAYQRVVYRMFKNIEASEDGITLNLPQDMDGRAQKPSATFLEENVAWEKYTNS